MADLTFVTPVALHHIELIDSIKATVAAQTVACSHVIVVDDNCIGAGWARNIGLAEVDTPFVSFLDCDDALDPRFAERCLQAFDGKHYVFTDHFEGDKYVQAPARPFFNKTWHIITTLLPTEWVRRVNGFDTSLAGGEDTELYLKLMAAGYFGKRLPEALFHYAANGKRSHTFVHGPTYEPTMRLLTEKYGRKVMACGDCGTPNIDTPPLGDPLPGDELAIAMWAGNRQERGRISGRLYLRAGNGKQMFVAPADIDASPHLWRRVDALTLPLARPAFNGRIPAEANVRAITPAPPNTFPEASFPPAILYGAQAVGAAMNDFQRAHFPAPPPLPPQTVAPATVTPDVAKAVALYRMARGG